MLRSDHHALRWDERSQPKIRYSPTLALIEQAPMVGPLLGHNSQAQRVINGTQRAINRAPSSGHSHSADYFQAGHTASACPDHRSQFWSHSSPYGGVHAVLPTIPRMLVRLARTATKSVIATWQACTPLSSQASSLRT
jgi:hypothetical protein